MQVLQNGYFTTLYPLYHRITDNFYLYTYEAEEKEGSSC